VAINQRLTHREDSTKRTNNDGNGLSDLSAQNTQSVRIWAC